MLIAAMSLVGTVDALVPSSAVFSRARSKLRKGGHAAYIHLVASVNVEYGETPVAKSAQELFQPLDTTDPSAFFAGLAFGDDDEDAEEEWDDVDEEDYEVSAAAMSERPLMEEFALRDAPALPLTPTEKAADTSAQRASRGWRTRCRPRRSRTFAPTSWRNSIAWRRRAPPRRAAARPTSASRRC